MAAKAIIDNIVSVLSAAVDGKGRKVFARVGVYESLDSFREAADPMNGVTAGVIAMEASRGPGGNNSEAAVLRVPMQIGVRFTHAPHAGEDDRRAVDRSEALADTIRAELAKDPTRGGNAHLVAWNGRAIRGTDFDGSLTLEKASGDEAFYTLAVPVAAMVSLPY